MDIPLWETSPSCAKKNQRNELQGLTLILME